MTSPHDARGYDGETDVKGVTNDPDFWVMFHVDVVAGSNQWNVSTLGPAEPEAGQAEHNPIVARPLVSSLALIPRGRWLPSLTRIHNEWTVIGDGS